MSKNGSNGLSSGRWRRSFWQLLGSLDFRVAAVLFVTSFSVYLSNGRLISAGDTYPNRFLPFSILEHGSLYLDTIADVVSQGDSHPYWIVNRGGHKASTYPVVIPVAVLPLYAPAVAWLDIHGWTDNRLNKTARLMEKGCSALIAALSVALMYYLLRRRAAPGVAALLTIAYALGTNTWMIGSQALWQHGAAELFIAAALFLLTGACTEKRALALGLLCGLIACNRPPDAILSGALVVYGWFWAKGRRRSLVVGAALPVALLLIYNLYVVRELVGGYARKGDISSFRYGLLAGVAGLLFSPTRGLFIFTPFLLFLPLGIKSILADHRFRRLDVLLLAAIVIQVLCYAKLDWRAGCSWGPRWLTDIIPLMIWMLVPMVIHARILVRALFGSAVLFSIGVQTVGAFWYTGKSDEIIMAEEGDPARIKSVWDFKNTPYWLELGHKSAPRGIVYSVAGYIDTVRVNEASVDKVPIGADIKVEGWTLTDLHTPAMATVSLVPTGKTKWRGPSYYPAAVAMNFGPRPDVSKQLGSTDPSGWGVTLRTKGFDPGEHLLVVNAKASDLDEFHPVARRHVMLVGNEPGTKPVTKAEFDAAAEQAKLHVIISQQPGGYWLTSYTTTDRFAHASMEMNTFLEAMMIDLLQPVAAEAGLDETLKHAHTHLFGQIESDGLVRYHGRPDSPTIPSLGCIITPDADDTALVWRIAGRSRDDLLAPVLRTLKSYQTPDGLFRTWLAPLDKYVSIDPGKEPNPSDITIQMHVLMFLDGVDRPSARALFEALQRAITQDSHWVYYNKAPLVPLLRQGDVRKLGYPLELPPGRIGTSVLGQKPWVDACMFISSDSADQAGEAAAARLLLGSLAADQFSAIKSNPPLLYHNDLTARAQRYYWSEDFGYALWLRLYFKYRDFWNTDAMKVPR
ncbi:MAG: hypothetical protein JF599_06360 [Verrucomicrobia bacterium]|nr:hypothetical protein [Verrucomicrobiota bacterium]